jgi:hypothetical protein
VVTVSVLGLILPSLSTRTSAAATPPADKSPSWRVHDHRDGILEDHLPKFVPIGYGGPVSLDADFSSPGLIIYPQPAVLPDPLITT